MGKAVGIDLGTTNSVVACAGGAGPVVQDSREGKPYIRSVVGCKKQKGGGQEILVGDVAEDNWPMAPHDTVNSVKRLMGRGINDPEVVKIKQWAMYKIVQPSNGTEDSVSVVMGGKEYSPAEISALILKKLKQDAEARLGEEVTHAVITVPAYFSQRQRDETREAGWKAGLKVSRILDEPTAAAIAFGCEHAGQDSGEPRYILVYDLGGGTFDISVLVTGSNAYSQLDLEGDMWLGGDNFDQLVVDYALERIKDDYDCDPRDNARFMVVLRSEARKAKERLTSARSAALIIPGLLRDADGDLIDIDVEITREEFENQARPLVDRTIELTERALKNAGLMREQVHDVLLAGNATNMPIVQQALDKMFGRDKVRRNMHPKHCVAMGAAILATRLGGIVCQSPDPGNPDRECLEVNEDSATVCRKCGEPLVGLQPDGDVEPGIVIGGVAPYCYGIQTADDKFNVFIKKNDPYPTVDSQVNTFYTQRPGQRMLCIPVYGGDHLDKASLNEKQGEAFANLPRDLPAGTPVHIRLWLDSNGIFTLQAFLNDGFDLRPWLLTGGTDQKAVRALERLELGFAATAVAALPAERERIEAEREQVFEQLRNRQAEEAEKNVEEAIQRLKPPADDDAGRKAEGLIGYASYVASDFGWALGTDRAYRLNKLVGEAREAVASGDAAAIARKVKELDEATDNLPDIVSTLLGVRGAIFGRVQPFEPALAATLRAELEQVEDAIKANKPDALSRFNQFSERLLKEIKRIEGANESRLKCPKCGRQMQPGQRTCPNCDWDTWVPADKGAVSTSSGSIGK